VTHAREIDPPDFPDPFNGNDAIRAAKDAASFAKPLRDDEIDVMVFIRNEQRAHKKNASRQSRRERVSIAMRLMDDRKFVKPLSERTLHRRKIQFWSLTDLGRAKLAQLGR
jgi:hypothetical protein